MELRIDQIAICPPDPELAIELLEEMGLTQWAHDIVEAKGKVFDAPTANRARLSFNYEALEGAREFEVLKYYQGNNWMNAVEPSVSHFGMHVSAHELEHWKRFFKFHNIDIAQEVQTQSHTNPVIAGKRTYHYCIFNTRPILGVDIKLIVRQNLEESND